MTERDLGTIPAEALLEGYPESMAVLADRLRGVVLRAVPDAIERVRAGWRVIGYDVPVGRHSAFFAWIMPERQHVHLGFPRGVLLDDPDGVLDGDGITKAARWFTLREPSDLAEDRLAPFVRSAAALAAISHRGRAASPRSGASERRSDATHDAREPSA